VESLSDVLLELSALSVSVEDADAHRAQEQRSLASPACPRPPRLGYGRKSRLALFETDLLLHEAKDILLGLEEFETCQLLAQVQVPQEGLGSHHAVTVSTRSNY
jgi:ribosomal protein L11 methyltransferase